MSVHKVEVVCFSIDGTPLVGLCVECGTLFAMCEAGLKHIDYRTTIER